MDKRTAKDKRTIKGQKDNKKTKGRQRTKDRMTINNALSTCGITTAAGRQAFAFDGFQHVADFALLMTRM